MKQPARLLAVALLAFLATAPPASAEFGFQEADVTFSAKDGSPAMQAGSHPFAMKTSTFFNTLPDPDPALEIVLPDGAAKDLKIRFPAGFVGNPTAVPYCRTADFLVKNCPLASQIGFIDAFTSGPGNLTHTGVYNLPPPPGVAAKIGFTAIVVPVTVELGVNPDPPYNLIASLNNIPIVVPVYGSEVTAWGTPAEPDHDSERVECGASCSVDTPEKPFLLMPRSCTGPLRTLFEADPWEAPGAWVSAEALTHNDSDPPDPLGTTGCDNLSFGPRISALPTSQLAESPTGFDVDLDIDDDGIGNPKGNSQSDIKKAVVTLPKGMTVNPSAAEGLATCSEADLARETFSSAPGQGCPQASKIGTIEAETPLLEGRTPKGSLFIAEPYANRFGTLLALYMVVKEPELGILVRVAGKVEPDPNTGQLITTFDDLPQFPLSRVNVHLREGGRSPLITPASCDTYTTEAEFTPWANPSAVYETTSAFKISAGVGGGPCPSGPQPFAPGFQAGSVNNNAGSFSPFYMRLTRRDGDRDLTRLSAKLPPGLVAKLAGTTRCADDQIALAKTKAGRQELAFPSCPASSEIGHTLAGAGVGSQLTYVPGSLYMAGPFGGGPLSVVAITPAVAGPFDVGTVVVRLALQINPRTGEVRIDGTHSDPLPHILAGIPLRVRDIRALVDRPEFMLNPTSCDPFAVQGELWGGDAFASLTDRYQAANCARLGFKPRLSLRLKGGTRRGDHPALRGTYKPRPGDANLEQLVLRFPRSAFLDQGRIRTICTRVQFAADACPKGAIYGRARVFTPILDQPLKGPVYLRSSNNDLPDFVADLHGLVDVEAVARIDSKRGGIRATFEKVPDAPISKVVVDMQGGRKGLIINSRSLCTHASRATARMIGHNAKRRNSKPLVRASCKKEKRARK